MTSTMPLPYQHAMQLESLDRASRLSHWMAAFAADEEAFASKAVFVEMRLRQALSSSVALGVPNTFRTAVVCDAFERVAPMTGRYEGVLVLIWKELVRAIFMDYSHDLPGSGAKAYAPHTASRRLHRRTLALTQAVHASPTSDSALPTYRHPRLSTLSSLSPHSLLSLTPLTHSFHSLLSLTPLTDSSH